LGGVTTVLVDDPAAAVHNPAGIAPLKHLKFFSLSAHTPQDVNYFNYGLAFPILNKSALGLSYLSRMAPQIPLTDAAYAAAADPDYNSLRYTSYQESIFILTYAQEHALWRRPLYWGVNGKFFNKSITDYEQGAGSAFNLDLGLYVEPWRDLGLGLKLQNVLQGTEDRLAQGAMFWGTGAAENIAPQATLGLVNRTWQRNLTLGLDFKKNLAQEFSPATTHFGAEWHPLDALFLRAGIGQYLLAPDAEEGGYNGLSAYYSAGLGLNIFGFRLDYAYCPDREVADLTAHYFSLSYVGGEPVERSGTAAAEKITAEQTAAAGLQPQAVLEIQYPTGNLTTTEPQLRVAGLLKHGTVYMLNGEEYPAAAGQRISRQLDLSSGLNDLLIGTPEQPEIYKFKILRLAAYEDIAAEKNRESIIAVSTLGYMSGDYPRRFNPRRALSRQELAAVVVRLNKSAAPALRGILDEVDILTNQGILKGFPDGLMRPDTKLTKGQLALVLARLLELPLREARPYTIVSQEHWADPAIAALENSGLYRRAEFIPRNAAVTKAELAVLLSRLPQVAARINALYAYNDAALEIVPRAAPAPKEAPLLGNDRLLFEEAARAPGAE
ncbi:MAG: S-layer homology domain-containing protein, partial [Candidatus Margulisbacteria bacterium]|nr:S-layer homology domain-containing protein [Candidatus Margulisiibacteriota bacterium]